MRTTLALAAALVTALSASPVGPAGTAVAAGPVDTAPPTFTDPLRITNPLFPISSLRRTVQLGPGAERAETTLLPGTRTVRWGGRTVTTRVSQFVAYDGPRIVEAAYDFFAQADDGSVWYLGENVENFEDGRVVDTHGTWLAGRDGPGGMIMPARPRRGDEYRPENIPGLVYERVVVAATGRTVSGPTGPVGGAIAIVEHPAGAPQEPKVFAPGYGEFLTGAADDISALAVAVPRDAAPRAAASAARHLDAALAAALSVTDAVGPRSSGRWDTAVAAAARARADWAAYRASGVPAGLAAATEAGLVRLTAAVDLRDSSAATQAALDTARAMLDAQLRHRGVAQVDTATAAVWQRQRAHDLAAGDWAGVRSDDAVLQAVAARAHPYAG